MSRFLAVRSKFRNNVAKLCIFSSENTSNIEVNDLSDDSVLHRTMKWIFFNFLYGSKILNFFLLSSNKYLSH